MNDHCTCPRCPCCGKLIAAPAQPQPLTWPTYPQPIWIAPIRPYYPQIICGGETATAAGITIGPVTTSDSLKIS
jgi:hypothetical protein